MPGAPVINKIADAYLQQSMRKAFNNPEPTADPGMISMPKAQPQAVPAMQAPVEPEVEPTIPGLSPEEMRKLRLQGLSFPEMQSFAVKKLAAQKAAADYEAQNAGGM